MLKLIEIPPHMHHCMLKCHGKWKVPPVVAGPKKKVKGADYKELTRNTEACKSIGKTIFDQINIEVGSLIEGDTMTIERIMHVIHKECGKALPKAKKKEVHHEVV